MRCHVHVNFVIISLPTLASKASANEHMIQMCHLDFVFLLLLFPRNEMTNVCCSLASSLFLSQIECDTSELCRARMHAAGKTFYGFVFFVLSHLACHLLLIKLKLDGKSLSLFRHGFRGERASERTNEWALSNQVIKRRSHLDNRVPWIVGSCDFRFATTEAHHQHRIHLPPWFNIIIGDSYLHFTLPKFFHIHDAFDVCACVFCLYVAATRTPIYYCKHGLAKRVLF